MALTVPTVKLDQGQGGTCDRCGDVLFLGAPPWRWRADPPRLAIEKQKIEMQVRARFVRPGDPMPAIRVYECDKGHRIAVASFAVRLLDRDKLAPWPPLPSPPRRTFHAPRRFHENLAGVRAAARREAAASGLVGESRARIYRRVYAKGYARLRAGLTRRGGA